MGNTTGENPKGFEFLVLLELLFIFLILIFDLLALGTISSGADKPY